MKQAYVLLLAIGLFAGACKSNKYRNQAAGFKTEIPTYLGGYLDIYYQLAKERQIQLGLDTPENGLRDVQARIWYNQKKGKERKLVNITNNGGNWTAAIYDLQVSREGDHETILSKKIRQVSPKSGWPAFSKKLSDLKIADLPNQDDVEGYSAGEDGTTYSVEFATKSQYRFYNYWEPQRYAERFWEAKNMSEMLRLVETEFGN